MQNVLSDAYRIRGPVALSMSVVHAIAVVVLAFAPHDWGDFPRVIALSVAMFIAGVLASQHTPIWERKP